MALDSGEPLSSTVLAFPECLLAALQSGVPVHMTLAFHVIGLMYRSVAVASRLAYDILSGLSHMNSLGFVHRNLSPSNVLLDHQVVTRGVLLLSSPFITDC